MGRLEIPLGRHGIGQAKCIARFLKNLEIRAIYTSPLKRALDTAAIVAEGNHVPVKTESNLTEVAFGRWEGYAIKQLINDKAYQRFLKDPLSAVMPGGETIVEVQERGLKAVRRATREFSKSRILFVTHGDVIRAILCHYLRIPLEEFCRLRIDNCSLSILEVDGPWAEIKVINYHPDVAQTTKEPYTGPKPLSPKKRKTRRGQP
jgi:broad specificity phosphatase PhoE